MTLGRPRSGTDRAAGDIRATVLDNGLRVLTERIEGVRSVAVGVWVAQGAIHETPEVMGASHMLEHMVFKGTRHRSALEIALSLEAVGGSLDAYTSREHTSYQARVLDLHLPQAVEVLADLVRNPLLRPQDLALERDVVLEEIAMVEDTPEDWVTGLTAEGLRELHAERYGARNLVVAAAGSLEHDRLLDLVQERFGDLAPGAAAPTVPPVPQRAEAPARLHWTRDSAQTHVVLGGPAPNHADPRRHAVVLLSQALGGGMSSRLFQRVREELGLAYAVYSFHAFHRAAGVWGVYLGTRPGALDEALDAVRAELTAMAREGLPDQELQRARAQVKGQLTLALESTGARLHRLAGSALRGEEIKSLDQVLALYDAVTAEAVAAEAERLLDPDRLALVALGPGATGDGSRVFE